MKKNKKKITFQEAYPAPFSDWGGGLIMSQSSMALTRIARIGSNELALIMQILNNESNKRTKQTVTYNRKEGTIDFDGKPAFLVRGWGHLTGIGALNLPTDEAKRIQDEFAEWVCRQLTTKDIEYAYK